MFREVSQDELQVTDPARMAWVRVRDAYGLLWEKNPKIHDKGGVIRSIEDYGFQEHPKFDKHLPNVSGGNGGIKSGNGRIECLWLMEQDGEYDVPRGIGRHPQTGEWYLQLVVGTDAASLDEAIAYAIDANNLTMAGADFTGFDMAKMWEEDAYAQVLKEQAEKGVLPVTADADFVTALLDNLYGEEEPAEPPQPRPEIADELREKWGADVGQMWALGQHRVICGDATDPQVVKRLMAGEAAQMMFTDPPWNIGIGVDQNPRHRQRKAMEADNLTPEEYKAFLNSFAAIWRKYMAGDVYCKMGALEWPTLDDAFREAGFHWSATIVWVKDIFVLGRSKYHRRYEPIWYGWPAGINSSYDGGRDQDDVWEFERPRSSEEHPTMLPIAIPVKAIRNSSRPGDLVVDPFLGSGTTLLACQELGRRCKAVEIDPRFVAVSLERFLEATGVQPELIEITAGVDRGSIGLADNIGMTVDIDAGQESMNEA